jgi:hypothetical protein
VSWIHTDNFSCADRMTQHKLLYYLGALLGLSLFSVVLRVLHRELRQYKEKFDPE